MGRLRCFWLTSLSTTVGLGVLCGSLSDGYLAVVPTRTRPSVTLRPVWRESPCADQLTAPFRTRRSTSTTQSLSGTSFANFNSTSDMIPFPSARNDSHTLWTYVYNLQRARRGETVNPNGVRVSKERDALIKSSLSLVSFLETHTCPETISRPPSFPSIDRDMSSIDDGLDIVEPLQRAVVQSIRGVSVATNNDYRLILRLFNAAIRYADGQAVLDPIVTKETILALGRTKDVNMNKIRSVWNKASGPTLDADDADSTYEASCWKRTVGPMEVNAMLQVLVDKGKLLAALDLFNKEHCRAGTDAYSVSILINAFTASLPHSHHDDSTRHSGRTFSMPIPTIQNEVLKPLVSTSTTFAWQWNQVVALLDKSIRSCDGTGIATDCYLNNPVLTALLQFNRRMDASMSRRSKKHALRTRYLVRWILDFVQRENILPDHVTSTLILSSLDDSSWELAVALLKGSSTKKSNETWSLPQPNAYMYSAAMACCARSGQYHVAVKLLHEMEGEYERQTRNKSDDNLLLSDIKPGLYVYNAVLQALVGKQEKSKQLKIKSSAANHAKDRLMAALELFGRMQVPPDIVTFNTLLAVMATSIKAMRTSDNPTADLVQLFHRVFKSTPQESSYLGPGRIEQFVAAVLNEMRVKDVKPDSITFIHAIRAVCETDRSVGTAVLALVERGIHESKKRSSKTMAPIDVCSAGLSAFADMGSVQGVVSILSLMRQEGLSTLSSDGVTHVVNALGNANMTAALPSFLSGDDTTADGSRGFDSIPRMALPRLSALHFATAITACLRVSDFESARQVLLQMRKSGVPASSDVLEQIAKSYAVLALEYSAQVGASKVRSTTSSGDEKLRHASLTRARSAFSLLSSIKEPSPDLISTVARACCSAGMVEEAQSLLRILHKRVLQIRSEQVEMFGTESAKLNENEKALPSLHRNLLKHCAEHGNVTSALQFCEDIQYLSSQLGSTPQHDATPAYSESSRTSPPDQTTPAGGFGMTASCWKSLIVAASKSGHWRVCLSSLQFLRPYLEATHPSKARNDGELVALTEAYGRLESTLNTVVKCLAVRSQYGWIIRAIDDWIEWCDRRPPRQAVLEAVRILAARGRGNEVNNLLVRCTSLTSPTTKKADHSYIPMLFVGAITALYNEGLYDAADDAFVAAISQQSLHFTLERRVLGNQTRVVLDLHGMNVAVAHSAVRIALQQEAASVNWSGNTRWTNDMVIVTGRGLNSAYLMRPVLRPTVQRMLVEEFYPPLSTTSIKGNMGAIRISPHDISEWLEHQRQQKGARLLVVAAMLKNFASPGGRLRAALSKATKRNEGGADD